MRQSLTVFRIALAFMFVLGMGLASGAAEVSATPKSQKTHQQRGQDFAEGCRNAGGSPQTLESKDPSATHVRCDFGDYAVSCVWRDSYPEMIEVCADSRGLVAPPRSRDAHGQVVTAGVLDASGGGGGQSGGRRAQVQTSGVKLTLADDNR